MDLKDFFLVDGFVKDKGQVLIICIWKVLVEGDMKCVVEFFGRKYWLYIEVKDFV